MDLNWPYLMQLSYDQLTEEKAETLFDQLTKYEPNGRESIDQLQKLFFLSKFVMQVKSMQAEVATEELREVVTSQKSFKRRIEDSSSESVEKRLREQNERLQAEIVLKDAQSEKDEQALKIALEQQQTAEQLAHELRQEVNSLRKEIIAERAQWSEQLADSQAPYEKMREMNGKFASLMEVMRELEETSSSQEEEIQILKEELRVATVQMGIASGQLQLMQNTSQRTQLLNKELLKEKEQLVNECEIYRSLVNKLELGANIIKNSSNKEQINLGALLAEKDSEIEKLRKEIPTSKPIPLANGDRHFLSELDRRDHQVQLLQEQLEQASKDMESQTKIIESLLKKQRASLHAKTGTKSNAEQQKNEYLQATQLKKVLSQLEEELKQKDTQLSLLYQKNLTYEQGIYGLPEALNDLRNVKSELEQKTQALQNTIQELNMANNELNKKRDELEYAQEWIQSDETLRAQWAESNQSDVSQERLKILKLQKEVMLLESENLSLLQQLQMSGKLTSSIQEKKDENSISVPNEDLNTTNRMLHNENTQLQMAMKEILFGLKESDSRSDVIIECPSLERLCQLLEARSLNAPLASVIALKAELDLLRGQNEELRMNNKRLRTDTFTLINGYLKFIMEEMETDQLKMDIEENLSTDNEKDEQINTEKLKIEEKTLESVFKITDDIEFYKINQKDVEIQCEIPELKNNTNTQEKMTETIQFQLRHVQVQANISINEQENNELEKKLQNEKVLKEMSSQTCDLQISTGSYTDDTILKDRENNNQITLNLINQHVQTDDQLLLEWIANKSSDNDGKCKQCLIVQQLLLEFQDKMERIEKSIMKREESYIERIDILQAENYRLEHEVREIAQKSEQLLKQKQEELYQEREKIVNKRDEIDNEKITKKISFESDQDLLNHLKKDDLTNGSSMCMNILETIIKCLQARIQYKDESIAHYQKMVGEMQNNFEQELKAVMSKPGDHTPPNSTQIVQAITNEHLEHQVILLNEELRQVKSNYQKYVKELRKRLELQNCTMKKLKAENQRLRCNKSLVQINAIRTENENLKQSLEQNNKLIEQLKLAVKEERTLRLQLIKSRDASKGERMQSTNELNELLILRKTLNDKERDLKETELSKWNSIKKKDETIHRQNLKLRQKDLELEKIFKESERLKKLLNKCEKDNLMLQTNLKKVVVREKSPK